MAALLVTGWGQDASAAWRDAVRHGIAHGGAGASASPVRRFVSSTRAHLLAPVPRIRRRWQRPTTRRRSPCSGGLLRAEAMTARSTAGANLLDRAIDIWEAHRAAVRSSLQEGVHEALASRARALRPRPSAGIADRARQEPAAVRRSAASSSTASSSCCSPRRAASCRAGIPSTATPTPSTRCASPVELLPRPRGLWETLQSIARLAHRGCRVGALRVTPFNGHLFSPHESPLADALRARRWRRPAGPAVADDAGGAGRAGSAFVRRPRRRAARRRLRAAARRRAGDRRSAGDANPAVRQAASAHGTREPAQDDRLVLHAAIADGVSRPADARAARPRRRPDRILALRIVDPAMGSGAFLVAACRYLAAAYESALLARRRRRRRRHRRARAGRLPTRGCAALPLWRRHQPDGGAARPAVALAGNAGGGPAADVSGSPAARGQQPRRRRRENLSREPPAPPPRVGGTAAAFRR